MRLLGLIASLSSLHTRAAGGDFGLPRLRLRAVDCFPVSLQKTSRGPRELMCAASKAVGETHTCIQVTKETAGGASFSRL